MDEECLSKKPYTIAENDKVIVEIFLFLNLWRASKSEKVEWELEQSTEHAMDFIMHQTFDEEEPNLRAIIQNFNRVIDNYSQLEFILFMNDDKRKDPTKPNENFIFCYPCSNPNVVILNRLVIFFSNNNFEGVSTPRVFEDVLDNLIQYYDTGSSKKIYYISQSDLEKIVSNTAREYMETFNEHLKKVYSEIHRLIFRNYPSQKTLREILKIGSEHLDDIFKYGTRNSELFVCISRYIKNKYDNGPRY